jgi:dienelactone hydrolase
VKKFAVVILALALLMMTFAAVPVMAEPVTTSTFQQITGKLGGATYLIQIPSNWQRGLVVMCIGYSHLPADINTLEFYASSFPFITDMGYALAMSNYGKGGMCVKEGVISTHQLTEYVIHKYHVTGKVYLFGMSMGGEVSLLLGAKYPHLYDGVLDVSGVTDVAAWYTLQTYYNSITDDNTLAAAILAHGGSVPPCPLLFGYSIPDSLAAFRVFSLTSVADIAQELGGTPQEKPKAYERVSPIFSAVNIAIPTITVHGEADSVVPYAQSLAYFNAVTQARHRCCAMMWSCGRKQPSDLYRLYGVPGAEHIDLNLGVPMYLSFTYLVNWVENGIPAPPSTP